MSGFGHDTLNWAIDTFGSVAVHPHERVARFLEEALEIAHALGLADHVADRLRQRVWSRPTGAYAVEAAQTQLTLDTLCAAAVRAHRDRRGEGRALTLGSHQKTVGKSQSHFTPRWIIDKLGPFDLDPCAGDPRPWDCASINVTEKENGLAVDWGGLVWLNPPFDRYQVGAWVEKLAQHGRGIALLHARTEAGWFEPIWRRATGILFLADRLKFCHPDGKPQRANSGAPAVLVSFGDLARARLKKCDIPGNLVTKWFNRP